MKRLIFLFYLSFTFISNAQSDSALMAQSFYLLHIKPDMGHKYDSLEIWKNQAIEKLKKINDIKFQPKVWSMLGTIYYEYGEDYTLYGDSQGLSNYFDTAKVYYSNLFSISEKKTAYNYFNHAMLQIWMGEKIEAKKNLDLSFELDTTQRFRDIVFKDISQTGYLIAYRANELREHENNTKSKELFKIAFQFDFVLYEIAPNDELAEYIFRISKESEDIDINNQFRKILIEEYNYSSDEVDKLIENY